MSIKIEASTEEWGPEKILQVYDPKTGMRGVLVIDNTALGLGKGEIRTMSTVTMCARFITDHKYVCFLLF